MFIFLQDYALIKRSAPFNNSCLFWMPSPSLLASHMLSIPCLSSFQFDVYESTILLRSQSQHIVTRFALKQTISFLQVIHCFFFLFPSQSLVIVQNRPSWSADNIHPFLISNWTSPSLSHSQFLMYPFLFSYTILKPPLEQHTPQLSITITLHYSFPIRTENTPITLN